MQIENCAEYTLKRKPEIHGLVVVLTALESTSCQAVSSCCVNTGSVLGGTWFQVLRWSVLASAAACYGVFSHAAEQPSFDLLPGTRACHVRVCKSKCIDSKSSKQPSAEP